MGILMGILYRVLPLFRVAPRLVSPHAVLSQTHLVQHGDICASIPARMGPEWSDIHNAVRNVYIFHRYHSQHDTRFTMSTTVTILI
jgi:hypothetical protein